MNKPTQAVSVILAFAAGMTAQYLLQNSPDKQAEDRIHRRSSPETSVPTHLVIESGSTQRQQRSPSVSAPDIIQLKRSDIAALAISGNLPATLKRLDLPEADLQAIQNIQAESLIHLKAIEKSHAKVIRHPDGDYVEVSSFPDERKRWMDDLESTLRTTLHDDRAALVAQLISINDNEEDVGVYVREIHVIPSKTPKPGFMIEEKKFDPQGEHIDSDYEHVDSRSKSHWGHLLDF